MVSQCALDLLPWKILIKTCCLNCLIRYNTIRWGGGGSKRFLFVSSLSKHGSGSQVALSLWAYMPQTENEVVFTVFSNLFENPLNVYHVFVI